MGLCITKQASLTRSALATSHQAFLDFKQSHAVVDGKFYIVHNGKVLENPQDSVSNALELLQLVEEMGGKVNRNALLVVEAGNEQGQRQAAVPAAVPAAIQTFSTVPIDENTDTRGYYVSLDFEPANFDTLLSAEYNGIIKTRSSKEVEVFFKFNGKKAKAFLEAVKNSHDYYKQPVLPTGCVQCEKCRQIVSSNICYHIHDRGKKTYECKVACKQISPPYIAIFKNHWPSSFPPREELEELTVPPNISHDEFFIHKATQSVYMYENCRCNCLTKWSKLTETDAKRLLDMCSVTPHKSKNFVISEGQSAS